MDQFSTRLALPEAPRDFGFWIDNAARDGREMFTRYSPGHGVAVTRIPKCTVDDLNAAVASAGRDPQALDRFLDGAAQAQGLDFLVVITGDGAVFGGDRQADLAAVRRDRPSVRAALAESYTVKETLDLLRGRHR